MSDNSRIEWTEATWNPVRGCTKVSEGCRNCYAETFAERWRGVKGHAYEQGFDLRLVPEKIEEPLHWKKPRRIFVNSMSDLFHKDVPFDFIDKVFAVMALCPQHTFQVLTKRPERMAEYLARDVLNRVELSCEVMRPGKGSKSVGGKYILPWPLPNGWLGTSIEDQKTADERIPHLLKCPAALRFLSYEPALGAVDLRVAFAGHCEEHDFPCGLCVQRHHPGVAHLGWVICGGESGPGARPCDIAWIRSALGQCRNAGIPCFVKQLGKYPLIHCSSCGRDIGYGVRGGFVDSCGPTHASLIAELVKIKHPKGGDPAEWPDDLRVREYPETAGVGGR